MSVYQHLDRNCQRIVVEHTRRAKPPCPECASTFALDGRTRAAMLAALHVEWVLLNATLREQGGGDGKGRYDLQGILYRRDVLAAAPGLYALCSGLPDVLGALNIALASGIRDAAGSDAARAVLMVERYWRHLNSSDGCDTSFGLLEMRKPEYPTALPLERAAALSPGLRGRSAADAYMWLDARRRGIGCGHGEASASVAGNAGDGPWLIHGVEVHIDDRRFRGFLRSVLSHIGDQYPEDLDRIRRRVSRIEYIRPGERPPRTQASYGDSVQGTPECIPGSNGRSEPAAWPIKVSRSLIEEPLETLVAVLVHELGHSVSTADDVEVRSRLGREWGSELAADHHAAKWGFGRLIRSMRPERSVAHHGPIPGEQVVVGFGEHQMGWRVTDNRVLVREGPAQ